ncbi:hypothetical protein HYV81_01170 [Candidatus Woesearchaeota archaeon]|nr:hypothetical protein [Candidatus Woesearchaeota archaeon]
MLAKAQTGAPQSIVDVLSKISLDDGTICTLFAILQLIRELPDIVNPGSAGYSLIPGEAHDMYAEWRAQLPQSIKTDDLIRCAFGEMKPMRFTPDLYWYDLN